MIGGFSRRRKAAGYSGRADRLGQISFQHGVVGIEIDRFYSRQVSLVAVRGELNAIGEARPRSLMNEMPVCWLRSPTCHETISLESASSAVHVQTWPAPSDGAFGGLTFFSLA